MDRKMFSLKQVSELMGISTRTLRRWRAQGKCPVHFCQVGPKVLRATESEVNRWLASLNQTPKTHWTQTDREGELQ